jgi:uncharacterized protein (TIGR03437 family)
VSLTSAAQSLAVSATPYRATIVISCNVPDSYAGKLQTVEISLLVSSAPSVLAAVTDLLSFTTSSTNPHAIPQVLEVRNTGSEAIGFGSVTCPPDWCRVRSSPISLQAGATGEVGLIADPAGLAAGYYYANLTIDSSAGAAVVPITFHIEANPSLALNPSGKRLTISAGGAAAVPTQSFLVNASGTATVNWTATLLPGAPWLSLNTPGGSSSGIAPGVIGYSLNQTVASTLSPQTYYGTIRVASAEVANSPQDFQIVLEVAPATAPQIPNPSPAGLVFLASAGDGSSAVKPQVVQFFTSSVLPVNYQASAAATDGSLWLSVSPSTGIMSASSPAQSNIIVTPSGLAPGVYQGTVTYASATAAAPAVNVTLIVHAPSQTSGQVPASCIPARIISTQTGLVNNFTALAGVPTPLEIELLDDCGSAMTNGEIAANFSNGDPAFTLALTNPSAGIYGGTWTPRHSGSQVTVTAQANAPGFSTVSTQISGAVEPFTSPVLASSGTLHVFNPSPGAPLAPGTIVQIYGSELASQTMAAATLPLPTTLGGTSVSIGGLPAPLFFASPGQVNAQIPFDLAPEQSYQVILSNNGALTMPQSIQLTPATPEVLALPSGYAIAQHVSDASAVTDTSPARPGEYIVIYLSGMGATTLPVASGAVAPSGPLAGTLYAPSITLNSEPVPVLFSGLTPGLVGLYQIDTQIPADAQNGDLPLVVSQPGYQAKPVILPVSRQALP